MNETLLNQEFPDDDYSINNATFTPSIVLLETLSPYLFSSFPTNSPTNSPTQETVIKGDEPIFEYALMLWFSAAMFIIAAILFLLTNSRLVKSRSMYLAFDVSSWASLYFAFAVTLVVYNKWLISVWEGGFKFPLTMTLVHMSIKLLLSWTVVRGCRSRNEIPKVSRWTYYLYACPVGSTTALDVAASNASLFYVSVTLYTVIKSTSLVFVLIYSVLYRLQVCSTNLLLVTGVIFAGVLMASYGESQFDAIGFSLVFASSALAGYRWALTEVLMQRIGTKMNSLMTIYTISPASVVTLIPFAAWLEWKDLGRSKFYSNTSLFLLAVLNVAGSGVFAFAMIYVELALLNRTSSLSLVIIGYLKQMAQIVISVLVFHEELSTLNVFGVIITFIGMGLYTKVKHTPNNALLPLKQQIQHEASISKRGGGENDNILEMVEIINEDNNNNNNSKNKDKSGRVRQDSYELVELD